ncbi:Scr1 family TA system antitoxin-like transcriptional regulator [Streptomyces gamaensis]|uniref:Scr1 family TA system antitoxin-like transcriptional regulator n=1 Tax=Streptomyces gamaensis TaxID=1763542 RepID=A0ABW0YUX1_9ACTN
MPALSAPELYEQRVKELAAAIREARMAKGWKQIQLAKAIALSPTAVSHFESGRVKYVPCRDVARRIDRALDAGGRIFRLRDKLDDNPDAKRVQKYLAKHAGAVEIRQICSHWVPPMLETEEHTRLCLEEGLKLRGGSLEDKVAFRRQLRAILSGTPDAPTLNVILREGVLRSAIGGEQVMRRQLLHLIERSHEPNVDVRVLPFDVGAEVDDVGFVTMWEERTGRLGAWRPDGYVFGAFIANRSDIALLNHLYDHLRDVALDPEATRSFIGKTVEELYPCRPNVTCP